MPNSYNCHAFPNCQKPRQPHRVIRKMSLHIQALKNYHKNVELYGSQLAQERENIVFSLRFHIFPSLFPPDFLSLHCTGIMISASYRFSYRWFKVIFSMYFFFFYCYQWVWSKINFQPYTTILYIFLGASLLSLGVIIFYLYHFTDERGYLQ